MSSDFAYVLTHRMAEQLGHLDAWFKKAEAHATARKFDVNSLLQARLAPDQFPLLRQIGSSCDTAKLAVARLTGKAGPVHPDTQVTLDECRARIGETIAFIQSTTPEDFAGWQDRKIVFPWMPGKWLPAEAYLLQHALPNFHFHYVTAYAILRHNGVELGKVDYIGALPFQEG